MTSFVRRITESRRLPPGARRLKTAELYIYVGPRAWAKHGYVPASSLVLPEDHDSCAYRWPVRDSTVTISWPRGRLDEVRRLFEILLDDGAARVVVVDPLYADSAAHEPFRWQS